MPHFYGVPFQQLMMAGGIAGALVVGLYILKLKRRPVPVPFSRIWERILRDKEATSLFSQLKRLLSLLLQLALLALLLLALGDPRAAVNLQEGRNVVVLIDTSASMQAVDVSPSRLEKGKQRIKEVLRGLGSSDRMLIAQMDSTVTPLSTMTSDVPELEAALAAVRASDTGADFAKGLRFATDTLRGLPSPEIVVVSDGALATPADSLGPVDLGDTKLSFVKVGESSRNAAITGFSVRRYPLDKSRYEAMLEVTNTGSEPIDLFIELQDADQLDAKGKALVTDVRRVTLKAGERLPEFLPNLAGSAHRLRAEIKLAPEGEPVRDDNGDIVDQHDDLPTDDVAYALMPERRKAKIQVVTSGNIYLEAALLLDEYLDVTNVAPSKYPHEGSFDVTIFDSVAPPLKPGSGHILYLNPTGKDVPFTIEKELVDDDPEYKLGFDEIEASHPILRHTQLADVNIGRASVLKGGQKEDKVLAASFRGPILITGRRAGYKFVALGLDVERSNLPLLISWPLFLLNTINDFVEEDTGYISSFATGTVWRVPAPQNLASATLIEPDGNERTVPIADGRAVFLGQRAGFYTLKATDEEAPYQTEFAANLADPFESTIAPRAELTIGNKDAGEVSGFSVGVRREIWAYLLLAVAAISAVEWLTYHRRITV